MTATQTPVTNLNDLADRIDATVTEALGASVVAFRALANESRVAGARTALTDATTTLEARMEAKREKDQALADAKARHASSITESEWTLGGLFAVRSNKTWLTTTSDGKAIPEDEQRSFTADEKAKWITHTAELRATNEAMALRAAELAASEASDMVRLAEKNWTAAHAQLNAAAAWLTAMSLALKGSNA